MGRYYRMSKKVTEDQVKEILRETLELEAPAASSAVCSWGCSTAS